jgi:hypothetical protein
MVGGRIGRGIATGGIGMGAGLAVGASFAGGAAGAVDGPKSKVVPQRKHRTDVAPWTASDGKT